MGMPEVRTTIIELLQTLPLWDSQVPQYEMRRIGEYYLRHFPDANEQRIPKAGGFWMRATQLAMRGPYTPGLPTRFHAQMLLTVSYPSTADPSVDEESLAFLHRIISDALLDPARWDRPDSTIISIHADGDLLMPATVDQLEGHKLLRFSFPVEYTT